MPTSPAIRRKSPRSRPPWVSDELKGGAGYGSPRLVTERAGARRQIKGFDMKWFLKRLSEPSTWAGFAGLIPAVVALVTTGLSPEGIGGVVAGVAAVLMREQGNA